MTTTQSPDMLDELLRVTTPTQPRLDYETLRARYEWLCSHIGTLYMVEAVLSPGVGNEGPATATKFLFRDYGGCLYYPASVDALVAKAMKEHC